MASTEFNLDPIDCSAQPLDLAFHPTRPDLVAAGLVDGTLEVHDFSSDNKDDDENDTILSSIPVHTQLLPAQVIAKGDAQEQHQQQEEPAKHEASCRAVLFCNHDGGNRIFTGGSGGDVVALDAERACAFAANTEQQPLWRVSARKQHGIQSMHQLDPTSCAGPLLVTGDEEGGICLWDERMCGSNETNRVKKHKKDKPRGCVLSWEDQHRDYVSGFAHDAHNNGNTLLAASADCTLGVYDLRKALAPTKPQERLEAVRKSDDQEDELLSICVLKNGRKVVCGQQEGVLAVWSWGVWGDVSDRFPGHPASIDAILKVDEDTILTGCSDGLLRLVQIHPDKLLGVLGSHDGFPIEKLRYNANKSRIGSTSHDSLIRLWDATVLQDDSDDNVEEQESEQTRPGLIAAKLPNFARATTDGAVADSGDEWDDDEEESDNEVASKPRTLFRSTTDGAVANSDDDWDDNDEQDDSDSDDSDDDDKRVVTTNEKRAQKFRSANEEFFADL